MYERKIKENLDCGINITMRVLGAKWKACIIDAIEKGHHRPSEIHRYIPEATPRVLDMQLSDLFELGVVRKEAGSGFPLCSEYYLTELGKTLIPIIHRLEIWGNTHMEEVKERLNEVT